RVRQGLAEFRQADRAGLRGRARGLELRYATRGGALRSRRCAPRARVSRWPAGAGRTALLHQQRVAAVHAARGIRTLGGRAEVTPGAKPLSGGQAFTGKSHLLALAATGSAEATKGARRRPGFRSSDGVRAPALRLRSDALSPIPSSDPLRSVRSLRSNVLNPAASN